MTPMVSTTSGLSAKGEGLFAASNVTRYFYTVSYSGTNLYVTKVNLNTFTVAATLTLSPPSVSTYPGIVADPNGKYIYVSNGGNSGTIYKISLSSFTSTNSVGVDGFPSAMVIDSTGSYLYFDSSWANGLNQITLSSFTVTATQNATGVSSTNLAIDPSNTYLYYGNVAGNGISTSFVQRYSANSSFTYGGVTSQSLWQELTGSITGLQVDNTGSYVYSLGNRPSNQYIYKFPTSNFSTNSYGSLFISGASSISSLVLDNTNTYGYVSDLGNGKIFKINLSNLTLNTSLATGATSIKNVVIEPTGQYLYAQSSSSLYKINLSTFTNVSSISLTYPGLAAVIV